MRIPTLVLLSSIALSLLVNADNVPPAANATVVAVAPPITANVATTAATDTNVEPVVAKPKGAENFKSLKMKEDGKTYPVGKGIVFTKTTFVVDDDKNKEKKMDSNDKKETDFSVQGLLGDLLGIDINLGGGGDKKKKKDPKTPPAEETDPDYIPLYGDDGYKPRPVPKGCTELVFLDQMIWDQQGNRGPIEFTEGPESTTPPMSTPTGDDATASPPAAEADMKDEKITTKLDTSSTVTVIDPKDVTKKDKQVDSNGIRICLLGGCSDDDDDDDNNDNDERRKIRHKQKKFLKQFLGKALKIDGRTGCPIPSKA
ncbi:hypothetical protein BGZ97_009418 [Linnemannia gamsii]|uniref:Uncharacterized protein n=1 Tax=Linnemannia gamsii TaxID=64522 RepID=A0A9P6R8Q8_9FUNG|nr:hypothetical protein BGZ97_009418 [Linnemannia gamsii]